MKEYIKLNSEYLKKHNNPRYIFHPDSNFTNIDIKAVHLLLSDDVELNKKGIAIVNQILNRREFDKNIKKILNE